QEVSLLHNESGVFEDSWVSVEFEKESPCVWTRGLESMDLPIRHGEGRFYVPSPEILTALEDRHLVALRYRGRNPNGSVNNIAGITDTTGRILGLMPHPEAFIYPEQHPRWQRRRPPQGAGLALLANGLAWAEKNTR
ncbi:MAG: phosphoribosylformylglycinamidine synthase subunit PurQ, partial [Spirochaetales bacterium]|nr:phosphoribosylformylglycinamidine synthase subunit PurQ [Spirochaetales bacterium]